MGPDRFAFERCCCRPGLARITKAMSVVRAQVLGCARSNFCSLKIALHPSCHGWRQSDQMVFYPSGYLREPGLRNVTKDFGLRGIPNFANTLGQRFEHFVSKLCMDGYLRPADGFPVVVPNLDVEPA